MPKAQTGYRCESCGAISGKWYGRCPKCGEYATVSDVVAVAPTSRVRTGVGEFDRVLGGGLVAGQVCLCSGPPGSGKSTLLLAVADSVARRTGRPVLYLSGEESIEQIGVRAHRIGAECPDLLLADD